LLLRAKLLPHFDRRVYGVGTPFGMDWQFFEGEITDDNISSMYELLQLLRVV
jgi:hypothetical protein